MTEEFFDPFKGGELLRVSPTTAPQKEIIAAAKMSDEANTSYNEAIVLHVDGDLDVRLLETCFNVLIERHDILRATFSPGGDEICLQEARHLTVDYEDLRQYDEATKRQVLDALHKNIAISPMNLEEGPLLFAWVKQLEDASFDIIVATHHVVCDGWSYGLLLQELLEIYRSGGDPAKLAAAPSFFEFAEQRSAAQITNADIDYWRERFAEMPPTLDLPLDRKRPAIRSFRAARLNYEMDKTLTAKLPKAAAKQKSSLVNFVMAAYFALLYRLSGNRDIVVGLPVAGQAVLNRLNMFGHMVQLIPIRLAFGGDTRFGELVTMVKQEVFNASEHPNFTFGQLLEKVPVDRSRVPLVSTIFNIDQPTGELSLGTASATVRSIPRAADSFELFLNIVPSSTDLLIEATYSTALFSEETVASWLSALEVIIAGAVDNPEICLDDLNLIKQFPDPVRAFNETTCANKFTDFVSAFDKQLERDKDAVAVRWGDKTLTYDELNQRSRRLAKHLSTLGVEEGAIVGVCCGRSEKLLVGTIAILRLGAAYLPLDPDFPPERLVYMLEDSAAVAVLEDDATPKGVREAQLTHIDIDGLDKLDVDAVQLKKLSSSGSRLAYTIYTSGSTGKPKGVKVQHSAMINFLESMAQTPGFSPEDRLLAVTTLSFDISVLELFLPLVVGGTIVIAGREDVKDGERLAALCEQHQITFLQATPSTWRMLLASSWRHKGRSSLKALCGGEPLPPSLVGELLPHVSELWNMYGPTETTVWSSCKKVTYQDTVISIGKPIANTQFYIVDGNLNPLPVSVPGELCIGGAGVTLGYHNRSELTAEKFVDHPKLGRIYRTGDVAKVLPGGDVQHLGRMDDQVKLRGYRIELGEIETALQNCPEIKQAAVYLWELTDQDVRIVACCIPATGNTLDTISLRKQLRASLPNYMVPQYFIAIETIPLTPNNKVDRRSLPRPQISESSILGKGALQTDTEKLIAGIWAELLKPQGTIGRDDNFFEIGGHSLLGLDAIFRIEKATGIRLELTELISERLSTLAEKATATPEAGGAQGSRPVALQQSAPRNLSPEQMRLLHRQTAVPSCTANNLPAAWRLDGQIDIDAFTSSLKRLFERQTALRSVVSRNDDGFSLTLRHMSEIDIPRMVDLSESADALDEALNEAVEEARQPFEIIDELLCRVTLYKLSEDSHLLSITPHQLIFDGWSFDLFLSELEAYYQAAIDGRPATLEPLSFQFRDYAHWASARQPDNRLMRFHRRLVETPYRETPLLHANKTKGACQRREIRLEKESLEQIEGFCEKQHFRIHEVLLAALCNSYGQLLNQNELCIGIPVTGRYTPDVIGLVGSFVSTLPAELKLGGGNFYHLARDCAEQLKAFYAHQELSLADLVKGTVFEGQPFPSIYELSFAFQDVRKRPRALADLEVTQIDIARHQTEVAIEFWARIQADGLLLVFDYDGGQVDATSIDTLATGVAGELQSLGHLDTTVDGKKEADSPSGRKKPLWRRLFQ